jgi:hypothetical protein
MRVQFDCFLAMLLSLALTSAACAAEGEAFTDPAKAGPDFAVQGEYLGTLQLDGKSVPTGVQVIAEGNGNFEAVVYAGGLPGAGWKRGDQREKVKGKTDGGTANFKSDKWLAAIADGKMNFTNSGGDKLGTLAKTERQSPTIGEKPPAGAVVLFDGSNIDHFPGGTMTDDHLLLAGAVSKPEYQDFKLHIEFRTPFMPNARGQGRGNSGVYLQNRYEVQVLDSFGLEGENNECGGLYSQAAPAVNMCLPPLAWQTYDIDFSAARFDGKEKTKKARVTIKHNGVAIYDDHEMPSLTPGGASEEYPGKGPLQLQFHGNPVTYRNIWVVEK